MNRDRRAKREVFRLPPPRHEACEVTRKRGYTDRLDALTVASRAAKTAPQRVYRCEFCGRYHLTSQPYDPTRKARR